MWSYLEYLIVGIYKEKLNSRTIEHTTDLQAAQPSVTFDYRDRTLE